MTDPGNRLAQVQSLVASERGSPHDQAGIVGELQVLCRAAARSLMAAGVGISLIAEIDTQVTVAASDSSTEQIEGLQFALGEGPCLEAYATRRPVLVDDLRAPAGARWPGYVPSALEHGVLAVFAFPLQVGAARLGAMGVYRDAVGGLSDDTVAQSLTFAEVAMSALLDSLAAPGVPRVIAQGAADGRYQVFQAQGMVMAQLGVSLVEAMARMRAYSYAEGRLLGDVAQDILAGKLALEPDEP